MTHRSGFLGVAALFVLLVTSCVVIGCSSSEPVSTGTSGLIPPLGYKEQIMADAMAGLVYEADQVVPDPFATGEGTNWDGIDWRAKLDEAWKLLERGRTVQATRAFTDTVLLAPNEAEPYEGLGRALVRKNWTREALTAP